MCSTFGKALLKDLTPERQKESWPKKLSDQEAQYSLAAEIWFMLCPDRNVRTLAEVWRSSAFEPNSPLDHALSILDADHRLEWRLRDLGYRSGTQLSGRRIYNDPWWTADFAFSIGRHYDALQKKPIEKIAISKLEEVNRNRESGKLADHSWRAQERRRVLNRLAIADGGFAYPSDKEAIRRAKALAKKHTASNSDDKLLIINGKLLSDSWLADWWQEFRAMQKEAFKNIMLTSK